MSRSATAGYSMGRYEIPVPSSRMAAVPTITSPGCTSGVTEPLVPVRISVLAPTLTSSSTAMAMDGQPIPVEVTETGIPR